MQRKLGFWMVTALVAGNMIGSGIFLLPASLAKFGVMSIAGWLFTATGALLIALVFARLSRWQAKVGGPYAYCREAFGDFIGFQVAYNYWIALWTGNAAIVVAFVGYLSIFFPILGADRVAAFYACLASVWGLTLVNLIGVREAGMVQLVTTILKILPLIAIAIFGMSHIDISNYAPLDQATEQGTFSALLAAGTLTLWAFIGMESATVPAAEVENPEKVIPKAILVGFLVTAVVYIASSVAVMGMLPWKTLANSNAPFADAAAVIFGPWGQKLVALGAAISAFGALNGWILTQARVPLAAARDNLFPKSFAKESRFGTPIVGLIVSATLISLLLLLTLRESLIEQFTFIILLAVLATLIPYLLTSMGFIIIALQRVTQLSKGKIALFISLGVLAFLYSFWAVIGSGQEAVFYGALLFFSGVPVYTWIIYHRK